MGRFDGGDWKEMAIKSRQKVLTQDGGPMDKPENDNAKEIEQLKEKVASQEQDLFTAGEKLRVLAETFDDLAGAVGWTKELCNQTGDSPMAVALELSRTCREQKEKIASLEAQIAALAKAQA